MSTNISDCKGALRLKRYKGIPKRRHPYQSTDDPLPIDHFVGDEAKILNSKGFRRLTGKPQVFPSPLNPNVRTRGTHTNEVAAVAAVSADYLGLNMGLVRAGALGHDIGHVPFGHHGEVVISKLYFERHGVEKKFQHAVYGVVVAQQIERRDGVGLNLTYPTLQAMLHHSHKQGQMTIDSGLPQECALVMYADKIDFTFADINDAVRMGRLDRSELPNLFSFRGKNQRALTNGCICALVEESAQESTVSFEKSDTAQAFKELRGWMYENVYGKIDWDVQEMILRKDYEFFAEDVRFGDVDPLIMLTLLTDTQATYLADAIRSNRPVGDHVLEESGILEMKKYIRGRHIDYADPDLHEKDFVY